MDKIQLIKEAIEKADRFESDLPEAQYDVPGLTSLKIRHLLNNLGKLGTHYLEIGVHKGCTFTATIAGNGNLKTMTAIDSFESDHMNGEVAEIEFGQNVNKFMPDLSIQTTIVEDSFSVDLRHFFNKIDFYLYDAGHSLEDQKNALLYYKEILADEFIYCCDDWQFGDVKKGTLAGIEEGGYEVLFSRELLNPEPYTEDQHLNMHWWRGYAVFLLKKKP